MLGEIEKIKFEKDILIQQVEDLRRRITSAPQFEGTDPQRMTERFLSEKRRADMLEEEVTQNHHVQSARRQLEEAKARFDQLCKNLLREVAELKGVHPLHALLSAKRAELNRVQKALHRTPKNHPERRSFENIYRDHQEELAHLELLVKNAEQVIEYQLKRIEEVSHHIRETKIQPGATSS